MLRIVLRYWLLMLACCCGVGQAFAAVNAVRVEIPAVLVEIVRQGHGAVEMDLPAEVNFLRDGTAVPATINAAITHASWPLRDETGVLVTQGPAGPGLRFTSGFLTCAKLPADAFGDRWTLACWLRPDDPDWGMTIKRGAAPPYLMRPVIAAVGGGRAPQWLLRLNHLRLQIEMGAWRAEGSTRLPVGRWTHVAVVRDGEQLRVYVDGTAEILTPAAGPDGAPAAEKTLGALPEIPPEKDMTLRLAGFPFTKVHPNSTAWAAQIGEKFIGAMGAFSLDARAWSAEEIRSCAVAGRTEADRLSLRYSVLDDPTVGSRSGDRRRAEESSQDYSKRTAWWRAAKFGQFLHWGPSVLIKKEISWSRGTGEGQLAPELYDNLYKQFNPVHYNPDLWAEQITAAGMRYAVFTTKHHDGFCEWPTKTTEHNIANSPYTKDIVGLYAAAMRKAGVRVGFYFSGMDFLHEDTVTKAKGREEMLRTRLGYITEQFRELCTNYGPVDITWFDGWGCTFDEQYTIQPTMLINDRNGPGDFSTPENFMLDHPIINPNGSDGLWETCSGTGGYWGYSSEQPGLTTARALAHLVEVVAKGGNWLCNVAPRETGELPKTHMDMLKGVGDWLQVNGASIYGTHRTHLGRQSFGWTTANATTLFLHVLRWPGATLVLDDLYDTATGVHLLASNTKLPYTQAGTTLTVTLPATAPDPVDTVIAVSLRRSPRARVSKGAFLNRAVGGAAAASAANGEAQGAAKAFDGVLATKWFNPAAVTGWLQYQFADGTTWAITQYSLRSAEDVPERDPKDWQLQASNDGVAWVTLDEQREQSFPKRHVVKRYVITNQTAYGYYRVKITANHGAPGVQLSEIQLLSYAAENVTPK
ncbi:MAG: alpha-L-fucosidase [Armatimonadota bacterium]